MASTANGRIGEGVVTAVRVIEHATPEQLVRSRHGD